MRCTWLSWAVVVLFCCQWSWCPVSGVPTGTAATEEDLPSYDGRTFTVTLENDDAAVEKRSVAESVNFNIPQGVSLDKEDSDILIAPLADFILRLLRTQIIKQGIQEMPMPEIHKSEFVGKSPVGITVKLDAWDGSLKDLSSIRRVNNVRLSRQGRFVIMEFDVAIQPLVFYYKKYEFNAGLVRVSGEVEGEAGGSLATLKLLVDIGKDSCNIALEDLKISLIGELDLQVTGLSPLNRFVSWITTKVANKFSDKILPQMAELFRRDIQKLLKLLQCNSAEGMYLA